MDRSVKQHFDTDAKSALAALGGVVVVLLGGTGSEREVSLDSGAAVVTALESLAIEVIGLDVSDDVVERLLSLKPAFAFIAMHGRGGEDGTIQAILERLGIPYSGSGVLGSALAMDKVRTKNLWRGLSLPTPAFSLLEEGSNFSSVLDALRGDVFVKPIDEGSSVGMARASSADELQRAYRAAAKNGAEVFAEQTIDGEEYTVAILGDKALPVIRIETDRVFYDYHAKYVDHSTRFFVPCGLDSEVESELQELALQAFCALGCYGWGRVDFMRDEASGEFYLLEANTVPGLTSHSLVPMSAAAAGIEFPLLIVQIIQQSLQVAA